MSDPRQPLGEQPPAAVSVEADIDPRIDLAVIRTELALDRTQLAWVRTAFTFITAGLALDKGAEALHHARVLAGTNWLHSSHAIGVILIAVSSLSLMISAGSYYRQSRIVGRLKSVPPTRLPMALLLSLFVALLGAILAVLLLTWRAPE